MCEVDKRRRDNTTQDTTQDNTRQYKTTQDNTRQHNTTQHNTTQHKPSRTGHHRQHEKVAHAELQEVEEALDHVDEKGSGHDAVAVRLLGAGALLPLFQRSLGEAAGVDEELEDDGEQEDPGRARGVEAGAVEDPGGEPEHEAAVARVDISRPDETVHVHRRRADAERGVRLRRYEIDERDTGLGRVPRRLAVLVHHIAAAAASNRGREAVAGAELGGVGAVEL